MDDDIQYLFPLYQPPSPAPADRYRRDSDERLPVSFRCWCCKDTGAVSDYALQAYGFLKSDPRNPPVLCRRHGCTGILNPTLGGTRFNPSYAYDILAAEHCQFIHDAELDKARSGGGFDPEVVREAARHIVATATMPGDPITSRADSVISSIDPEMSDRIAAVAAAAADEIFGEGAW